VRRRTVLVLHREPLIAEAIATALERFPWLAPIAIGRCAFDALDLPVDAIVIDGTLEGARPAAASLRERGRHAIVLGEANDVVTTAVATDRSVEELARALAPGMQVGPTSTLTARERDVLCLIAKGLAGKQTAHLLGISPKTVEQHKTRIYAKLGVANQAEAVAVAARSAERMAWVSSTT
jgi:DNA-binding CsgD family transcriptional regulator